MAYMVKEQGLRSKFRLARGERNLQVIESVISIL